MSLNANENGRSNGSKNGAGNGQGDAPPNGGMRVGVGINPIVWSNDDFRDLGGDIPLERCLSEMKQAGYAGTELGHKFPRNADVLSPLLDRYHLQLVSGWHSLHLLERDFETEARDFTKHVELLERLGSSVAIVAECSRRIYDDPTRPLHFEARDGLMSATEWTRLSDGLDRLARLSRERGVELVYHHHMGTLVQTRDEIDVLMERTRDVRLLVDTGHLTFADADPAGVLRDHIARVGHVHLKDVRAHVLMRARSEHHSFSTAVRAGVFTVPGDGNINFAPLFELLGQHGYRGWLVVEAEQNPERAHPLHYARMGREHVRQLMQAHIAEVQG